MTFPLQLGLLSLHLMVQIEGWIAHIVVNKIFTLVIHAKEISSSN